MWYNKGERRGKYGKIHSENGGKEVVFSLCAPPYKNTV